MLFVSMVIASLLFIPFMHDLVIAGSFEQLKKEGEILSMIEKNPDDAILFLNLGNIYMKQGKFDVAITQYKFSLKKGLNIPELYANIAICQQQVGDYEGAKQSLIQYIYNFPNNPEAYLAIGILYEKLNQQEIAESAYKIYKEFVGK